MKANEKAQVKEVRKEVRSRKREEEDLKYTAGGTRFMWEDIMPLLWGLVVRGRTSFGLV